MITYANKNNVDINGLKTSKKIELNTYNIIRADNINTENNSIATPSNKFESKEPIEYVTLNEDLEEMTETSNSTNKVELDKSLTTTQKKETIDTTKQNDIKKTTNNKESDINAVITTNDKDNSNIAGNSSTNKTTNNNNEDLSNNTTSTSTSNKTNTDVQSLKSGENVTGQTSSANANSASSKGTKDTGANISNKNEPSSLSSSAKSNASKQSTSTGAASAKDTKSTSSQNGTGINTTASSSSNQTISKSYTDNSTATTSSSITSEAKEEASWYEKTKSTLVVGVTTVVSGLVDIVDELLDGALHIIADLNEATGYKENAQEIRNYIQKDLGDELNEYLYNEDTGVWKDYNSNSFLKYDSKAAKKIRNASKKIGEITLATVSPGATTLVLGFLAGSGNSAEKKYQNVDENGEYNFNWKDEILIDIAGILGSLSWTANKALGKGFVDLKTAIKTDGLPGTIKQIWGDIGNLEFLKTAWAKEMKGLTGATNILNTTFEVAPDIMDYITGDKDLTLENVVGTIGKGTMYLISTILLSELKSYIKNPHYYGNLYDADGNATKALTDELERLRSGDTSKIMSYTAAQQKEIIDEFLYGKNSSSYQTDDLLYSLFDKLSPSDADKLLKNLSSDSERQVEIVKKLALHIMIKKGDDITIDDVGRLGENFQKYIIQYLPESEQEDLAKEAAKLYEQGKLSLDNLRKIIDPKDESAQKFLDVFTDALENTNESEFEESFSKVDAIHEFQKYYEKYLNPIAKTVAKTATSDSKTKIIHEATTDIYKHLNPSNAVLNKNFGQTGATILSDVMKNVPNKMNN